MNVYRKIRRSHEWLRLLRKRSQRKMFGPNSHIFKLRTQHHPHHLNHPKWLTYHITQHAWNSAMLIKCNCRTTTLSIDSEGFFYRKQFEHPYFYLSYQFIIYYFYWLINDILSILSKCAVKILMIGWHREINNISLAQLMSHLFPIHLKMHAHCSKMFTRCAYLAGMYQRGSNWATCINKASFIWKQSITQCK